MIYSIKEAKGQRWLNASDKLEDLVSRIFGMRLDLILTPPKDKTIKDAKNEVLSELVDIIQGWHTEDQKNGCAPYAELAGEENANRAD